MKYRILFTDGFSNPIGIELYPSLAAVRARLRRCGYLPFSSRYASIDQLVIRDLLIAGLCLTRHPSRDCKAIIGLSTAAERELHREWKAFAGINEGTP